MSFKLGDFDTESFVGLEAILESWPSVSVRTSLDDLPAGVGSTFYRSKFVSTRWVFNLTLTGGSVADVMAKSVSLANSLEIHSNTVKPFIPTAADGWQWDGVVSDGVDWERHKKLWFDNGVSRLTGELTITTPNPLGYRFGPGILRTTAGLVEIPDAWGGAIVWPLVRFRGVVPAAGSVNVGGLVIKGPVVAGQELVVDFEKLEFYLQDINTGVKVRNVADRITTFARVGGEPVPEFGVSVTGGTITEFRTTPVYRRV